MKFRSANFFLLFSLLLLGFLQIPSTFHAAAKSEENPQVPIDILQKALKYVQDHNFGGTDRDSAQVLARLEARNVDTLYEVAKSMNTMKNQEERLASIEIWDALAEGGHTLSQVALGFSYSEVDKARAIMYFVAAAEGGPHQGAMYNAGRLLAEPEIGDFVKSLAYLQGAYNMGTTKPQYSTNHLVETSKLAYERLSEQLIDVINEKISKNGSMMTIEHIANMFMYSDINHFPPDRGVEVREYSKALRSMHFHEWELSVVEFETFAEKYNDQMSDLQKTIVNVLKVYSQSKAGHVEL